MLRKWLNRIQGMANVQELYLALGHRFSTFIEAQRLDWQPQSSEELLLCPLVRKDVGEVAGDSGPETLEGENNDEMNPDRS